MRWILLSTLVGLSCMLAGMGGLLVIPHFLSAADHTTEAVLLTLSFGLIFTIAALYFSWKTVINERKNALLIKQEQHGLEIKLHEENLRFETLFQSGNIGIALLNLDGRILRGNTSLGDLLGYKQENLQAVNYFHVIHASDVEKWKPQIQKMIEGEIYSYQSEQRCLGQHGDIMWVIATLTLIRDALNKPVYFMLQVQNISLQKKAEERLSHMAYHDPLTSLANRNKLEQFIDQIIAASRRHQQAFALLFLDLDSFKNINDTIGHEAGDVLLQIVAERLRKTVRNTDMVARLGGDEFVVLVTDIKKSESAALIAQKILKNVLQEVMIKGKEIYITASIGISLFPYDGQTMQTLMKNADLALYRAKEHGRNSYQFYTQEMTERAQEKLALQSALGHALVKNEFMLYYQPKMDIRTRRIIGVEALLRWKNKEYAMLTPDEIISVAEETGLILLVSDWIIKTGCQQLKTWHNLGYTDLTLAINCTSRQLKQESFTRDLLNAITQISLTPKSLEIEVTESMIMQDPEMMLRVLYSLKDLGVQIAIDDFGTGYWSLNHLRRLSVDRLKIDKSFIKQINQDETSAAIIRAIIAMTNNLKIKSVAEGVETREQYDFLAREGCTEMQGYYIAKPLSAEAITVFLKHPIPDAEIMDKGVSITNE
jgi:diguanylate cyclase (GGDEF)-like protein/PAS domain S-box-containing protein